MLKKSVLLIALIILVILGGYYLLANNKQESNLASDEASQNLVGGDKDEHGCIGSAGYSWCAAKNSCIRVWEQYCTAAAPKKALFACGEAKEITAVFYPSDDKYVDLALSDGRNMSIPRAVSASGARYAKADESFVFWNKGDTAFITEGTTTTFSNCVIRK
jgi:membrane-bound inhibitor of C-type lysozyme